PITAAELNRMETAGDAAAKTATWGSVSNKPSTFPPADHDHAIADVTGLQSALDGKQASGNYATTAQVNAKADQTALDDLIARVEADRKSTRLNSSHVSISYAVFCLKKINKNIN